MKYAVLWIVIRLYYVNLHDLIASDQIIVRKINEIHMKKLISLLFGTIVLAVSCDKYDHTPIWDKLNDHEERILTLEELCGQLNTNIESLKSIIAALQNNDYVTNVVAIVEGGKEIGYTLYFSKSDPVTIYHGKDGKGKRKP